MPKFVVKLVFFVVLLLFVFPATTKSTLAYTTNMNASVVIGQQNFTATSTNTSANGLNSPEDMVIYNDKLVVADYGNNRVLIFNKVPDANGAAADVVIGQQNFTSGSANQGGSAAANTLSNPQGVATDGTKLFIADAGNNRILIYNSLPTQNNVSADVVIGQTSMTATTQICTQTNLNGVTGVLYDPVTGKLAAMTGNGSRVLIYNKVPTANGAAADVVVGQTSFTSCSSNTTSSTLQLGESARIFDGKLIIDDAGNNRVLIFNSIPTSNGAAADVVIGQQNFTSNGANQGGSAAANTLNLASAWGDIFWDGKRLFVKDGINHRILVFYGIPTTNNASANLVLGQPNFTASSANQGGSAAANTLNFPDEGILSYGNQLLVSDYSNNRILIYNNVIQNPGVTLNNSQGSAPSGKVRMNGTATIDSLYTLSKVEYSVNGDVFHAATPVDGSFNGVKEDFYMDIDPHEGKNTGDDYTLRVRSTNTNLDNTENVFFFTPFNLLGPADNEATTSALPTFEFSVNKQQTAMRDYVSKYQIQIARDDTGDFKTYIDNIPVDFQSVKNFNDNLQRAKYQNITTNNGVYETAYFTATYSRESSDITVTAKNLKDFVWSTGRELTPGTYKWKVIASDKTGNRRAAGIRTFKVVEKQAPAIQPNTILGEKTTIKTSLEQTHESIPSAVPSPTPTPQDQLTKLKHKFCIWFLCF